MIALCRDGAGVPDLPGKQAHDFNSVFSGNQLDEAIPQIYQSAGYIGQILISFNSTGNGTDTEGNCPVISKFICWVINEADSLSPWYLLVASVTVPDVAVGSCFIF